MATRRSVAVSLCLVVCGVAYGDDPAQRLNPHQPYVIANAPIGKEQKGFWGEYFEVYSPPIKSQYSQVIWEALPPVALPDDIVERYDGKVMAVTGHEVNVIRKLPNGEEQSVPCYESYNHHYTAFIKGKNAIVEPVEEASEGYDPHHNYKFRSDGGNVNKQIPIIQAFSEHNGNEARQSYHGLPPNVVQPVESPEQFLFTPMQINTRNPDGSGRRCRGDCPLPRASMAPPNASYSGLLECPCTTRVVKTYGGHFTQASGVCQGLVTNATECFNAAITLIPQGAKSTNATVSDATKPVGCFVERSADGVYTLTMNTAPQSNATCDVGTAAHIGGSAASDVTLTLDVDAAADVVTITLAVNDTSAVWYGVGFNASSMADLPYTIIVDGAGNVTEHKLGNHVAGTQIASSLKVVSQTSANGVRTTVLQRPLKGLTSDHFTFSPTQTTMGFISAVGSTSYFSQHRIRAPAMLSMFSVNTPTCVCRSSTGSINGFPFRPNCMGEPKSDLLKTNNPTCDINLYGGGMSCCRGNVFLLDADQEIPALVDTVYFRWRFYFTDWQPTVHTPVMHLEWQFGHIEYDVPAAPAGTPPEDAVHTLTTRFTLNDFMDGGHGAHCNVVTDDYCADPTKVTSKGVKLIMMGGHCHSPACLGIELYNGDTGEMLCHIKPVLGQNDDPMDEESYLWLPPCQWGRPEDGYAPPPTLYLDTNLTAIKRANATVRHYGVMAIFQGRGAYAEDIHF